MNFVGAFSSFKLIRCQVNFVQEMKQLVIIVVLSGVCMWRASRYSSAYAQTPADQSDTLQKWVQAYQPIPVNRTETADYRWLQKPVRSSRLLDNMERLDNWRCDILKTPRKGLFGITSDRVYEGAHALKVTAATKGTDVGGNKGNGRPWEWVVLRRDFKHENWSDYNRLSVQVYPDFPGFRRMSVGLVLYNEGSEPIPDAYYREGFNYVMLEPGRWNHIVWEIPQHARDKVTGVGILYRTQGNEPEAADTIRFYVDKLELQTVVTDHYEGWQSAPQTILYSHSGYQPQDSKIAFTSDTTITTFTVTNAQTGQTVFSAPARSETSYVGTYRVCDFSGVTQAGMYQIKCKNSQSRPFRIADDVWKPSIWKTINLFFCERCGYAVPGIHGVCHRDWLGVHGEKQTPLAGGWHDAGDVSQSLQNTAEAVYALFGLSDTYRTSDPALSIRLQEEARWGLDWLLRNRFDDGYRVNWTTIDFWTDGILGTVDDVRGKAQFDPFFTLQAVLAEAEGAKRLARQDSVVARYCRRLAVKDWQLAMSRLDKLNIETATIGSTASLALFRLTADSVYALKAIELADYILLCQQQQAVFDKMPLAGFFYRQADGKAILSYDHHAKIAAPIAPLIELCEAFPSHPNWMNWYASVRLYTEYFKKIGAVTYPYHVLPASVYNLRSSQKPTYQEQVMNGLPLDSTHYLRVFPVWYGFRGNLGIVLSHAVGLAGAGQFLNDSASRALARHQLEWVVGKNPFGQSLMYGEGHNYAPQYTVLSGDMVGSLPVGIQTSGNKDVPYWSASNCYNYKEVWVHPSIRWLEILAKLEGHALRSAESSIKHVSHERLKNGRVRITAETTGIKDLSIRFWQMISKRPGKKQAIPGGTRTTWEAQITSTDKSWLAVVVPTGNETGLKEIGNIPWNQVQSRKAILRKP